MNEALPNIFGLQTDERAQTLVSETHKPTIRSTTVDLSCPLVRNSQDPPTPVLRYYEWGEFAPIMLLRYTDFRQHLQTGCLFYLESTICSGG